MNLIQRLLGGKPKTNKPPKSEAQVGSSPILPYPGLPVLDPDSNQQGIKAFFVTREYANYALINLTIDGKFESAPLINTYEGPIRKTPVQQFDDGVFLDNIRTCGWNQAMKDDVALGRLNGHPIVLVDVITYPFMFAMMHDLQPGPDVADWLWRMNHNMILRFIDNMRFIGPAYSFFHTHAEHIEHNPVHNLIAACPNYSNGTRDQRDLFLQNFAASFEHAHIVSSEDATMDCRYCYDRRLPEDGAAVIAEVIKAL